MPQSIGCHHCGRSNIRIADYPNQRIVRDRPCAVWGGVQPRYVDDPYRPADVHRSCCVGIGTRRVWVPVALMSSNVWCCTACGMSALPHYEDVYHSKPFRHIAVYDQVPKFHYRHTDKRWRSCIFFLRSFREIQPEWVCAGYWSCRSVPTKSALKNRTRV